MRDTGIEVADTSKIDMEEEELAGKVEKGTNGYTNGHVNGMVSKDESHGAQQDWKILATDGSVKGWVALNIDEGEGVESKQGLTDEAAMPSEAVMQTEVMDDDGAKERL